MAISNQTIKDHYDNLLGPIYSWTLGDFKAKSEVFRTFLTSNDIKPFGNKIAIDLGAGNGLQSIPLAEVGFDVIAIDLNRHLLKELQVNASGRNISVLSADMRDVEKFAEEPELIICAGDTISHLSDKSEVKKFITKISKRLVKGGKAIFSFRDYSNEVIGQERFILVKSSEERILTCVLDYEDEAVIVTDLLYEKFGKNWKQKASTYRKVRIIPKEVVGYLELNQMRLTFNGKVDGLTTIIAIKQ